MDEYIKSFLFFLQTIGRWLPFTRLTIHYKEDYFPIVLPRSEFHQQYAKFLNSTHVRILSGRSGVMYMGLNMLRPVEWVTFVANEERDEFVQYKCSRLLHLPLNPWIVYIMPLLYKLTWLHPRWYLLDFPQPKTKLGKQRLGQAIKIAKETGAVPLGDFKTEYLRTNQYPRSYHVESIEDSTSSALIINCGHDPLFAAKLGEQILEEIYGNHEPVMVKMGIWGE